MGVTYFNIEYDREKYHPGQMVSGRVVLRLDKPKELRAVELTLSGKAKCHWTSRESYTDSEGKTEHRDKHHNGKENFFKSKMTLAGKGQKFELPIGEYVYPFSVSLPAVLPSTYKGTYGGVTYCGKVKMDVPWAPDKAEKRDFTVESLLNLNELQDLNRAYRNEKSKTFCCWCCASGPLTVTVEIPRTAYVFNEPIPLMIEVDNASNVKVNSVNIELRQKIHWKADDDSKSENIKLKSQKLGAVEENGSKTWNEDFSLGPNKYPSANCRVLRINYELEIEVDAKGPHSDLELKIPLTIGDIPYGGSAEAMNQFPGSQPPPAGVGFAPPPDPNSAVGYNPGPYPGVGFAPTNEYAPTGYPAGPYPGAAPQQPYPGAVQYPGGAPPANYGTPYPGGAPAPYPGGAPAPYPGGAPAPYPGGAPAPYSGGAPAPYGAPQPNVGAPYAGSTPQPNAGGPYPGATSTPNPGAPYSQPAYAPPYSAPPAALNSYPEGPPRLSEVPQPIAPADPSQETNPLLEMKPVN